MVMKPKKDLFSFFHFGFIRRGAKKDPDRIYAWSDPLSHPKKKGFQSFSTIYIALSPSQLWL